MDRRDQDCYFYYYSTCLKGDECAFRHEPAALGCETICPHWQKRACMNVHCNLRHMQLRKNRKLIPCYWENQPSGCRKAHCPFLHKYPRGHVLVAHPTHPGHVSHPGLPSHPNHPTHPGHPVHSGHGNHPNHPGYSGHLVHSGHPGHLGHSVHSGHSGHSGHLNHQNHSGHSNHQNHQNHQNLPVMEAEKKEGELQVDPSQVVMERGEWARGGYDQPQENVQVNSGEAPAQGNPRGGNQANGGQGSMPDPLVVSFDDGMRLY